MVSPPHRDTSAEGLSSALDSLLSNDHRAELEEGSGIAADVIAERGYKTIWGTNDPLLLAAGFKEAQRRGYGWIAPLYSPLDANETIYKPNDPRKPGGKTIKYEYPKGHAPVLDVHPRTRPMLASPAIPLFVTEGVKKGDSLVSRAQAAASLQGVYGWRGRNVAGGVTTLPVCRETSTAIGTSAAAASATTSSRKPSA